MSVYAQQSKNIRNTWILIIIFIGIISGFFYAFGAFLNRPGLLFIGLAISLSQAIIGYFWGSNIAIATSGGKEVTYEQSPQIHEMVENLSRVADVPKPKIYISPDLSANAFATGNNPKNAKICINQGLINILDKSEMEGVLAHEISHIKNRDILIMTMVSVLAGIISFVVDMSSRMMFFGGFSNNNDNDNNKSPIVFIVYLLIITLAPILSILITMSISRQREYLADATAVTMTRYPEGLINALTKLYKSPVPSDHYSTAMNHFYISPPKQYFGQKINSLFSTHPTIEQRVSALRKM